MKQTFSLFVKQLYKTFTLAGPVFDRLCGQGRAIRASLMVMLVGTAASVSSGETTAIVSEFDTSDEGWVALTATGGTTDSDIGNPRWESTGGNPGGYFAVEDEAAGGVIYYSAPNKFLGDQSGTLGTPLEYDVTSTTTNSSFERDDVVLEGAGYRLLYRHDPALAPDGWNSYWAPLEPGPRWRVMDVTGEWDGHNWTNLSDEPTEAEFQAVLGDLTAIFIRGEYWSGSTSLGLDNVRIFPTGETGVPDEPVDAYWVGGDGDWMDPSNWSTDEVPNNGSPRMGYRYRAIIDQAAEYTVTLNADVEIDELVVDASDASLRLEGGLLSVPDIDVSRGSLVFAGGTVEEAVISAGLAAVLEVTDDSALIDVVLSGTTVHIRSGNDLDVVGDLTLNNSTVRFEQSSFDYTRLRFVDGRDQLLGGDGEIVFDSTSSTREDRQIVQPTGNGEHLVIASGITIRSGQSGGLIGSSGRSVTNHGDIVSDVDGSTVEIIGAPLVNNGTFTVRQGARLDVSGISGDLETVTIEDAGSRLVVDGDFLINQNIDVPEGARLTLQGEWSNAAALTVTDATLDFEGTWTNDASVSVTDSMVYFGGSFQIDDVGNFDRTGGDIRVTGSVRNTGSTITLNSATGDWALHGGRIIGGEIAGEDDASLFITSDGYIEDLTFSNIEVTITTNNNLDVEGDLVLDQAVVRFERGGFNYTRLRFVDGAEQTLGGTGEVVFDSTTSTREDRQIVAPSGSGGHLVIDSGITIRSGQSGGTVGSSSLALTNYGEIISETSGSTVEILGDSFTNEGVLIVRNGGQLELDGVEGDLNTVEVQDSGTHLIIVGDYTINNDLVIPAGAELTLNGNWTNAATITATDATLNFNGTWSNAGSVVVEDTTVNLAGTYNLADLGSFTRTNGTVTLSGNFENTGTTVHLDADTGDWLIDGATIVGGEFSASDGAGLQITSDSTFQDVTLTDIDVVITTNNNLNIEGDLTLNQGNVRLERSGFNYTRLRFVDAEQQLLTGQGEVIFDSTTSTREDRQIVEPTASGGHLVIDTGITVRSGQSGGTVGSSNRPLTNRGTIISEIAGSTVEIYGSPFENANDGELVVRSGGRLEVNGLDGNLNTVTVEDSGTHLVLNDSYVINENITVPDGASLTLLASWRNEATLELTEATLNLNGTFTTDDIGGIDRTGGTVQLLGTLDNTGDTLALDSTTGNWDLNSGMIIGGTISGNNEASLIVTSDSDFDDVLLSNIDVVITTNNNLDVVGDLTLDQAAVRLERSGFNYTRLRFVGGEEQMIAGQGEVIFDSTTSTREDRQIIEPSGSGSHLVIGADVTIRSGNSGGTLGTSNLPLTNHGEVVSEIAGSTVEVYGAPFLNEGALIARNGGRIEANGLSGDVNTVTIENPDSHVVLNGDYVINENISVPADANLSLLGAWVNQASLNVVDMTLDLDGNFTTADIGTINRTGGAVRIRGTLDNTGDTLTLNDSTGDWELRGGKVIGGTIDGNNEASLIVTANSSLEDVTLLQIDTVIRSGLNLDVEGDLLLDEAIVRIERDGFNYTRLRFVDGAEQLLGGQGEVLFDSTTSTREDRQIIEPTGSSGHLVIGSGVAVRSGQSGGTLGASGLALTNHGEIISEIAGSTVEVFGEPVSSDGAFVARAGGRLDVNGLAGDLHTVTIEEPDSHILLGGDYVINENILVPEDAQLTLGGSWRNEATLELVDATLDLGGDFATADIGAIVRTGGAVRIIGALDNSGETLSLDASTGDWQLRGGKILGGTVAGNDEASLVVTADSGLEDVTVSHADLVLSSGQELDIEGDLMLDEAIVRIERDGFNYTRLRFVDGAEQLLGGQGEVQFASTTSTREDRQIIEPVGSETHLTFGPGITIRSGQSGGTIGADNLPLTNQGQIVSDVAGSTVEVFGNVFSNEGALVARDGGRLEVNGLAGDLNTVTLHGEGSHILLDGEYVINENLSIPEDTHLTFLGSWTNEATLTIVDTTLELSGNFTTADIGNISRTGGAVQLSGVLDNTGATVALDASTGDWELRNGQIIGGTVSGNNEAALVANGDSSLDGVSFSEVELVLASGSEVDVEGDLVLDDAIVRFQRGGFDYTRLRFVDGAEQALTGQGEVIFDSTTSTREDRQIIEPIGSEGHLVVGADIVIFSGQSGGTIGAEDLPFTNNGEIISVVSGSTVEILGDVVTNNGRLEADHGGLLTLERLTNNDGQVYVGPDGVVHVSDDYPSGDSLSVVVGAAGSEAGQLSAAGVANLSGTLEIEVTDDYYPELGDSFTILSASSLSGVFDTVVVPDMDDGQSLFEVVYHDSSVEIQVGNLEPLPAYEPFPGDGDADIVINPTLSWSDGGFAESYEVYLGTDSNLEEAHHQGTVSETSFEPEALAWDTTYFWRVNSVNDYGSVAGAVWSFTTRPEPTVGDGTVWVAGSGDWSDGSNWSSSPYYPDNGSPDPSDSYSVFIDASGDYTITLDTSVTIDSLVIDAPGATVRHTGGTLNVIDTVEVLNGTFELAGGRIEGGSWSVGAEGEILVTGNSEFADVFFDSSVDLTIANSRQITVDGDLGLDGIIRLRSTGSVTRLRFSGGEVQNLTGSGEIIFDGTSSDTNNRVEAWNSNSHLVIGSGITIRSGERGGLVGVSREVTNHGLIASRTEGRTVTVSSSSETVVNHGTLEVTAGGILEVESLSGDLNELVITDPGSHAEVEGAFELNQNIVVPPEARLTLDGTWNNLADIVASDATVDLRGDWANTGLISATDSLVNLGGSFSLVDLGTFDRTGGTVRLTGTLENTGEILALDSTTGSWALHGGTIDGGTIATTEDAELEITSNSTLRNTTLNPSVDITIPNSRILYVAGDLTLDDAIIRFHTTGSHTRLRFDGGEIQNLQGTGEIIFDGSGSDSNNRLEAWNSGSHLVIGEDITIRSGTMGGLVGVSREVTNHGLIASRLHGHTISLGSSNETVTNFGTLEATGGGILEVDSLTGDSNTIVLADPESRIELDGDFTVNAPIDAPSETHLSLLGSWSNNASITAADATLDLEGAWTNNGGISVTDSLVSLGGEFSPSGMGTFNRSGGVVRLTGTFDNSGETFILDSSTGSWTLHGGTIKGGTLATANGAGFNFTSNSTFENVTLDSSIDFVIPNSRILYVVGDLTLDDATIRLESTGSHTRLRFDGGAMQNLAGSGEIVFDGSSSDSNNRVEAWNTGSHLVIGPGITIRSGERGGMVGVSRSVTNNGVILSQTAGRSISFDSSNGTVFNTGRLEAIDGGLLDTGDLSENSGEIMVGPGSLVDISGDFSAGDNLQIVAAGEASGEYGRLDIGGVANLEGGLAVTFGGNYAPEVGDRYDLISASSVSGEFASFTIAEIGGDGVAELIYDADLVSVLISGAPPLPPHSPTPADEADDQPLNTFIAWSDGGLASSFDVYFGTNPDPGVDEFQGTQVSRSFEVEMLEYGTTYFWRIDGRNETGVTAGPVWSFTTRPEPASITGIVWHDEDGDGEIGGGEAPLEGWQVYLDLNDNGRRDSGEPIVETGEDGTFSLDNLAPGDYVVRQVVQPTWAQTYPEDNAAAIVTVQPGEELSDVRFGNQQIGPVILSAGINRSEPVPASDNLRITVQFDRELDTAIEPLVEFLPVGDADAPVVAGGGEWVSGDHANDTYRTPPIEVAAGMDGVHEIRVSGATDLAGREGDSDIVLTVEVNATAPAPPSPVITDITEGSLTIDWSGYEAPDDINLFRIYREDEAFSSLHGLSAHDGVGGSARTYTFTELDLDREYHVAVGAVDSALNLDRDVGSVVVEIESDVPPALTPVIDSPRLETAAIDWSGYDSSELIGFAGYRIYREEESFSNVDALTPIADVDPGTVEHEVTGLDRSQEYYFAVVPYNRLGEYESEVTAVQWQDPLSETITENLAFGGAGEEVVEIFNPLVVDEGAILTIRPGTTIRFDEGAGIDIVDGALLSQGTALLPVHLTALTESGTGQWNGVRLGPQAGGSELFHTWIRHGAGLILDGVQDPILESVRLVRNYPAGLTAENNTTALLDEALVLLNNNGAVVDTDSSVALRDSVVKNNDRNAVVHGNGLLDARENWWGTDEPSAIDDTIDGVAQTDDPLSGEPVLAPAVMAEGGADMVGKRDIELMLNSPNAISYRVSEDSTFSGVFFEDIETDEGGSGLYHVVPLETPFTLSDGGGVKTLFVQFRSASGDTSEMFSVDIEYVTDGPQIVDFSLEEGDEFSRPVVVTGSATATLGLAALEFYVDDELVISTAESTLEDVWDFRGMQEDIVRVRLEARDAAGNIAVREHNVRVSPVPPAAPTIESPASGELFADPALTVSGQAEPGIEVRVNRNGSSLGSVTAGPDGSYELNGVTLTEGVNELVARAVDVVGSSSSSPVLVSLDTVPPAPLVLESAEYLVDRGIQVFWRFATSGKRAEEFRVLWHDEPFTNAVEATGESEPLTDTEYFIENLPDGDYYVGVVGLDAAGNVSELSEVVHSVFDATPPSFTVSYDQPMPVGPGELGITLTASEALRSKPTLTVRPTNFSGPIVVTLEEAGANTYTGAYAISPFSGSTGVAEVRVSGRDLVGNSFSGAPSGSDLVIDVDQPTAAIDVDLPEPIQVFGGATELSVTVTVSKAVPSAPEFSFAPPEGSSVDIVLDGEGTEWEGSLTLTEAMGTGIGTFVFSAEDALGNSGNTISDGGEIEIYNTEDAPPPPIPTGVEAFSRKGGVIAVAWQPSDGAEIYHLYREEGAIGPAPTEHVGTLTDLDELVLYDLPPEDGVYRYAVTSERLGSESDPSGTAAATSDRTPPEPPENVAVELTLSGRVQLSWEAPSSGETPAAYYIYRNEGEEPIRALSQAGTVFDAPPRGMITYRIASVDSVGNENLSESVSIEMFVGAVEDLIANISRYDLPELNWSIDDEEAIGFNIYLDDELVNDDAPLTATAYTLDELPGDEESTVAVRAVDSEGREGAARTVTIFPIEVGLRVNPDSSGDERSFVTSYFDRYEVFTSNAASTEWEFETITVTRERVGDSPSSHSVEQAVDGSVEGNESAFWDIIFPGPGDRDGVYDLIVELAHEEDDGSVVNYEAGFAGPDVREFGPKVSISSAEVPLAGGLNDFTVRFFNRGHADMDVVLARNGGQDPGDVVLEVIDTHGEVVNRIEFDRMISGVSVTTSGDGFLRIPPGESKSFTIEDVLIPENLSDDNFARIEVSASSVYYDLSGEHERSSGPLDGHRNTSLTETPYYGIVESDSGSYADNQPIVLTGSAIDRETGELVPNADLQIGVSVRGVPWWEDVTTDASGNFVFEYNPPPGLGGNISLWAAHPDVVDVLDQIEVQLARLLSNPSRGSLRMSKNDTLDFEISLINPGEVPLDLGEVSARAYVVDIDDQGEEIQTEIESLDVVAAEPLPGTLSGNTRERIYLQLQSTLEAPDLAHVEVEFSSEEGATAVFRGEVTLLEAVPILRVASPSRGYVDRSVDRGDFRSQRVVIENAGLRPLEDVELTPPENVDWMQVGIPADEDGVIRLPDLDVGDELELQVILSPPDEADLGFYDDVLRISGSNAVSEFELGIFAEITSSLSGSAQFAVINILDQEVPNASVRLRNTTNRIERGPYYTDSLGEVLVDDLQEGRWSWQVSAPGHSAATGTVEIEADQTILVEPELNRSLVTVTFEVVPVPYTDRYEIRLEQTFETRVPLPVMVMTPPKYDFTNVEPGFETTVMFEVRNEGLVSIDDVEVSGYESGAGELVPLIDFIPELKPEQVVQVPARIRLFALDEDEDQNGTDPLGFATASLPSRSPGCGASTPQDFVNGANELLRMAAEGEATKATGSSVNLTAGALVSLILFDSIFASDFGSMLGELINCASGFFSSGTPSRGSGSRGSPSSSPPSFEPSGNGCFIGTTPVAMSNGSSKPIADLRPGDRVRSGEAAGAVSEIRHVYELESDDLRRLSLRCLDGVRDARELLVTGAHRLWVDGTGWLHVRDIEEGDWLSAEGRGQWEVVEMEPIDGVHTVYNFQLKDDGAFYADGVLAEDLCGGLFVDLSEAREVTEE